MTSYLRVAAVIALVVMASSAAFVTFGLGTSGFGGGVDATPWSSPALLARGNFTTNINEIVELEATAEGPTVRGRMTVLAQGELEPYAWAVDLRCARRSEDGLIMIGGVTTDSTGRQGAPQEGTWAGIVLERGSPVGASTWRWPLEQAVSCLGFLDEMLMRERSSHLEPVDFTDPVEGNLELGP